MSELTVKYRELPHTFQQQLNYCFFEEILAAVLPGNIFPEKSVMGIACPREEHELKSIPESGGAGGGRAL